MLLFRRPVCLILMDLGFQGESFWSQVSQIFSNFARKNDMLELMPKINDFWRTFGRRQRQCGGLPKYADSAEHGEWIQSRPAPPAGVRRIFRATPFATGPV